MCDLGRFPAVQRLYQLGREESFDATLVTVSAVPRHHQSGADRRLSSKSDYLPANYVTAHNAMRLEFLGAVGGKAAVREARGFPPTSKTYESSGSSGSGQRAAAWRRRARGESKARINVPRFHYF